MSGGGGSSSGAGIPVLKAMAQGAGAIGKPSTLRDLGLAVLKIISYMCLGVLIYTFKEINEREDPEPDDWDWNVIECFYFTMVTITTVGYGDMPLLSQEIRVVTAFFGIVGVVQIAGSLNVIAEWCAAAPSPGRCLARMPSGTRRRSRGPSGNLARPRAGMAPAGLRARAHSSCGSGRGVFAAPAGRGGPRRAEAGRSGRTDGQCEGSASAPP